jgi:cytochrome c biogenesis protein
VSAGPSSPPETAGALAAGGSADGIPADAVLAEDALTDGLPEDAAALGSDWGSTRKRRTVGAGPRLGVVGWLRWGWRQLTSMRTALVLLFLLAVAAIPGSVLPQRSSDPLAVNDWIAANPGIAPALDRLGFFDAFAAPWFSAIYILLFVSLIGCVLPRTAAHWRAMRAPTPPAPRRLDRLAGAHTWTTTDPGVLAAANAVLRGDRWRVTPGPAALGGGAAVGAAPGAIGSLAAEKGFARETGNLLFHVALLLLLVGVALGALFGWKGTVIVREGSGFANTLTQYDSFAPGRLASTDGLPPFSFTMTDFEATFERDGSQRGAPRSFSAQMQYRAEPGAPVQQRTVSVNSPLRLDGAKIFLVGHGYAPHLRLTDSTGRVVFDDTVVFLPQDGNFTSTGVVKAPDATPQLGIEALLLPTAALDEVRGPHSSFPAPDDPAIFASAWIGDLGLDTGVPSNVFTLDPAQLERLGIEALRPGEAWQLPDGQGTLEFVGLDRWASFTISHDPGKLLALASAAAAILGLSLSLFVRRRRIWVRVDEVATGAADGAQPAGTGHDGPAAYRVQVAGLSRTDSANIVGEVDTLVARIGGPGIEEEQR